MADTEKPIKHVTVTGLYIAPGPTTKPEPLATCAALALWAKAANVTSPNAGTGYLAVAKSCLLDRLINGGEKGVSQTPCPVHKGKWSGIHAHWPGMVIRFADGHDEPANVEPALQKWYDAGCRCFMHRCGCTTGWQPDAECGCAD